MTVIDTRFSPDHPISCAQGRHGEVIIAQGHGVRPARWDGGGSTVNAGMDAPTAAPQVTASGDVRYYVARTDVVNPGAVYYGPPEVTYDVTPTPPAGRAAKAAAYLNQASVSEIVVQDGGKYYPSPPNVNLSATHGSGAVIEAVLDATAPDGGNPFTGISDWQIISQPGTSPSTTPPRFAGLAGYPVELPISGNGTFEVDARVFIRTRAQYANACRRIDGVPLGYTKTLSYTVSGYTAGSGAVLRLSWEGGQWVATCSVFLTGWSVFAGATGLRNAEPARVGAGYGKDTIRVTIASIAGDEDSIVLEGYTAENPANTAARRYSVSALRLTSGGSGYAVAPQILFTSNSGFGAAAIAEVSGGRITKVTLTNSGGGYKTPPAVEAVAGGAEAFAVARPHFRGVYQCYYRYIDDTSEEKGGPIPSNLSPVTEVDTGAGSASLQWSVPAPSGRAKKVELWRTTGNQATLLYRVHTGSGAFTDDLTDEEARDPDRAGYAAMPIVLPNGELNANRFGVPPSDKSVVVKFQDRFWYGVDTSGKSPNAVLFSEVDEPESVPDINELILQNNDRSSDVLTAMAPFGSSLLLFQERHAHSLTFARQPLLDAQVSPLAYRGALNQRCWAIHDGVCYVMDASGVYSLSMAGEVKSLSDAIGDIFRNTINYALSGTFFLTVEPSTETLRAFVSFREDGEATAPTRVLCMRLSSGAWYTEAYSCGIRGATACRLSGGDYRYVYATNGGAAVLEQGAVDIGRGAVVRVRILNRGSGYTRAPAVSAPGSGGATFRAVLGADGGVDAIHIVTTGYGYDSGALVIDPPAAGGTQARADFDATQKDLDVAVYPPYWLRTRRLRYITDSDDPAGGSGNPRHVTVLYTPQQRDCYSHLRLLYNDSDTPRVNVAARNRGVGFSARTIDAAWVANIGDSRPEDGNPTYRALLEGRSLADISSADRFVAIELSGAPTGTEPVSIHSIDVEGVMNEQS